MQNNNEHRMTDEETQVYYNLRMLPEMTKVVITASGEAIVTRSLTNGYVVTETREELFPDWLPSVYDDNDCE